MHYFVFNYISYNIYLISPVNMIIFFQNLQFNVI